MHMWWRQRPRLLLSTWRWRPAGGSRGNDITWKLCIRLICGILRVVFMVYFYEFSKFGVNFYCYFFFFHYKNIKNYWTKKYAKFVKIITVRGRYFCSCILHSRP
uniref:Uncharacterized protein n=1 Tax=Ixodes ricinus TaxID=34613 RepID=A0A6B0UH96_IXORI